MRLDFLFRDIEQALPSTRRDPRFEVGINGAGGLEVGALTLEAWSADARQSSFEVALEQLLENGRSIAASDSAGHLRLTLTLVPEFSNAGLLLSSETVAALGQLGVEIAVDADPSASWYEARFASDPATTD